MTKSAMNVPLRIATFNVIREYGIGILEQHRRFVANVLDQLDPEARTTEPFERNCTPDVLKVYYEAARQGTPNALDVAARKVALLLAEKRMLRDDIATRLACELAFGVGTALGIGFSEHVRTKATLDLTSAVATPRKQSRPQKEQPSSTAHSSRAPNPEQSGPGSRQGAHQGTSRHTGAASAPQQPAPTPQSVAPPQTPSFSTDPAIRREQAIAQGISLNWNELVRMWCYIVAAVNFIALAYIALGYLLKAFGGRLVVYGSLDYLAIRAGILATLAIVFATSASLLRRFKRSGFRMFCIACISDAIVATIHFYLLPAEVSNTVGPQLPYWLSILNILWMLISLVYYNRKDQKRLFSL